MNKMSFAQLCASYAATVEEIGRLQTLPPQYFREEQFYTLQWQLNRKDQLKAEMQRRLREGK